MGLSCRIKFAGMPERVKGLCPGLLRDPWGPSGWVGCSTPGPRCTAGLHIPVKPVMSCFCTSCRQHVARGGWEDKVPDPQVSSAAALPSFCVQGGRKVLSGENWRQGAPCQHLTVLALSQVAVARGSVHRGARCLCGTLSPARAPSHARQRAQMWAAPWMQAGDPCLCGGLWCAVAVCSLGLEVSLALNRVAH